MNIDVRKTRNYYEVLDPESLCHCNYCKNYYSQIKAEYPAVASYLSSLGIDIEKPFELSPLEPDENKTLEYCSCQYIAFGRCAENFCRTIDQVEICVASNYPNPGIAEEHFVLELSPIRLKILYPL